MVSLKTIDLCRCSVIFWQDCIATRARGIPSLMIVGFESALSWQNFLRYAIGLHGREALNHSGRNQLLPSIARQGIEALCR